MKLSPALIVVATLVPLSGCLSFGGGMSSQSSGVVALGGGLIGQTALAAKMPSGAKAKAVDAEFQALQFGQAGEAVRWQSDGYSGEVVPTQVYRVGSQDCRGYSHVVSGASAPVKASGTACKTENGLWKPVA